MKENGMHKVGTSKERTQLMATDSATRTSRRASRDPVGRRERQRLLCGVATLATLALIATTATTATAATAAMPSAAARAAGAPSTETDRPSTPDPGSVAAPVAARERGKGRKNGPWSGFRIRRDGTAAGGWIGAWKLGGRTVYRIDPAKKPTRSKYAPTRTVADAGKKASRRESARAAYILSRYGTYRYEVQSAAVDVAIGHLLSGQRYALKGRRATARMRQTGQARKVGSFARTMLKDAARHAGAPRLKVRVSGAAVGGTVRATVRLASAAGKPMAGEVVRVRYPGSDVEVVKTDQTGTALATFVATEAGRHQVRAAAAGLPAWKLSVRKPKKSKASRVARAGVKGTVHASGVAVVTVKPTLQVTSPAAGMLTAAVPGSFVLAGGEDGTRTATVRLHGPFSSAALISCAKSVAATRTTSVAGNGTYAMPSVKAPAAGFYTWSVAVAGDSVNEPVSGCGGSIAIKTQPAMKVTRGAATYKRGELLKSKVTVSGLPSNQRYADYANVKVYGPFNERGNVRCSDAKLIKRTSARITGNGSAWADPKPMNQAGYYALVVTLPAGTFSLVASSRCEAAESTVRFQ